MSNNSRDELNFGNITSNYIPLTDDQKQFWTYKVKNFQISPLLAPSYLRLPDGHEYIALWIEMNDVGHQVVVLERSRFPERMFNPKELPLKLEIDAATGYATVVPSGDGFDHLTAPQGKRQLLYPVTQCNEAAALIVKNRPGNVVGDSYITDDGGFWTYDYHSLCTMADYDELKSHFQDFRSWVELHEARKYSGFPIPGSLESGTEAHADEFKKMSGL